MADSLRRDDVRRLVAQLLEVLPVAEHDEEHLPGADIPDAIRPGPATVRAHEDAGELVARMHARKVTAILVTDPEGRLLGLLHRDDADAALARAHRSDRQVR